MNGRAKETGATGMTVPRGTAGIGPNPADRPRAEMIEMETAGMTGMTVPIRIDGLMTGTAAPLR